MKKYIISIIGIALSACSGSGGGGGSPSANVETPTWTSYSVESASSLPTCAGDVIGRLYYIEDTNTFKVCKSTGWTDINVGITISSVTTCTKVVSSLTFKYNTTTFSNGSKNIFCSISDNLNTISNSNFYIAAQNGATLEGCILTYDLDTASAGYWVFQKSGGTKTATYNDSGSGSNGLIITYAGGDCSTAP